MAANPKRFTEQKPLTLALDYIHNKLDITDSWLNQEYGLNRCTLAKIRRGEELPRQYETFMSVFVRILNDKRISYAVAKEYEKANAIIHIMADILLVEYNIPTDKEKNAQKKVIV